jgi:DHA1 family bicyclomycin/chloramphenicol resistance-like MFS transporter
VEAQKPKQLVIMKKRNTTLIFISLLLADLLGGIEVDLFMPSFPEIAHIFNLSPVALQLMMSINMIGYCIGALVCGFLGDRYGTRSVILWTMLLFTVGSIFCVWAPNYPILVFGRLLQGLGISGPVVLTYVVITYMYPPEQQAKYVGFLNGVVNLGIAIAPILGSHIAAYAGWRGNFIALLIFSIVILCICFFALPYIKADPTVKLSLSSYVPLLKSKLFWIYMGAACLAGTVYWIFTGFSSLLYIEELKVNLKDFGWYQGILAGAFGITCMLCPLLYRVLHQNVWMKMGMLLACVSISAALAISIFIIDNPLWITICMVGEGIGLGLTVNVLWLAAVDVLPNTKSRASALLRAGQLLVTGIGLEIVGFFYNHTFYPIALCMFICMMGALWMIRHVPEWNLKLGQGNPS